MEKRLKALSLLLDRIERARGADRALDADLAKILLDASDRAADEAPDYTESVDRCLELLHALLPDWHWHLGRDALGVFPYASLSKGKVVVRADGTTVPLVLLEVIVKALIAEAEHA